jgi:hypothetical protein
VIAIGRNIHPRAEGSACAARQLEPRSDLHLAGQSGGIFLELQSDEFLIGDIGREVANE